jgi:hypothetical protein
MTNSLVPNGITRVTSSGKHDSTEDLEGIDRLNTQISIKLIE